MPDFSSHPEALVLNAAAGGCEWLKGLREAL
jgi:hypothetical protein